MKIRSGITMSEFIDSLSDLPLKVQEDVLGNLNEKMVPIDIDGNIHMIHEDVSNLIDNLLMQLTEIKQERDIYFGGKKND
tara:strand:- start:271 stop:510 length:240 start_codon:yes stop_codon:yes gene_type:complete